MELLLWLFFTKKKHEWLIITNILWKENSLEITVLLALLSLWEANTFYPVLFAECETGRYLNTSSRKAGFACVADIFKEEWEEYFD